MINKNPNPESRQSDKETFKRSCACLTCVIEEGHKNDGQLKKVATTCNKCHIFLYKDHCFYTYNCSKCGITLYIKREKGDISLVFPLSF